MRQRQGTESGSALDSTVRSPQPQALARSSSPPTRRSLEAGVAQETAQVGGGEGVDVDLALQRVAVGLLGLGDGALAGADEPAPDRRERASRPLRQRRETVAVARGLAGEGDRAARPQHPPEFGEGAVEVGDVVEDGVAEDEVEALVLERQRLGLGGDGVTLEAERLGGGRERLSIPGEMSVAVRRSITPSCTRLSEK